MTVAEIFKIFILQQEQLYEVQQQKQMFEELLYPVQEQSLSLYDKVLQQDSVGAGFSTAGIDEKRVFIFPSTSSTLISPTIAIA